MTLGYFELNPLTLFERSKTVADDCAKVDKYVGALILLNEAEALVGVEPLNGSCSCRHNLNL